MKMSTFNENNLAGLLTINDFIFHYLFTIIYFAIRFFIWIAKRPFIYVIIFRTELFCFAMGALGYALLWCVVKLMPMCFNKHQRLAAYFRREKVQEQSVEDVHTYSKVIESLLWQTKHIPLTALLTRFITSRTRSEKLACMMGVWQLYSDSPPSDQIKDFFSGNFTMCSEAMNCICAKLEVGEVVEEQGEVEKEEDWKDEFKKLIGDPEATNDFFQKYGKLASVIAVAVSAVIVLSTPFKKWLTEEKVDLMKITADTGRAIQGKKLIVSEVTTLKNELLSTLYEAFGEEYIPEEDKAARLIQKKCVTITKELSDYETKLVTDFFGVMRDNAFERVANDIASVEDLFSKLSQVQKSQYNLVTLVTMLKERYQALIQKRAALITSATGKQSPVVVQFVGETGVGKTVLTQTLSDFLSKFYNISVYTRNVLDEYWSGFSGQQIVVYDDLGFGKEGQEYHEFSYLAESAPSTSVGAAIVDKGRQANPLFILASSNETYLGAQGHNIKNVDAFHRRRDLLIKVENKPASVNLQLTGSTMNAKQFRPQDTILTLLRSVPSKTTPGDEYKGNELGTTTFERIKLYCVEKEKLNANLFKQKLRNKPFFDNPIPADEPVDEFKLTHDFLLGRPRPADDVASVSSSSSEESVKVQARSEKKTKHPLFLFLGPSGIGKTHVAMECCATLDEDYVTLDLDDFVPSKRNIGRYANKVLMIDDFTMSEERIAKAAHLAHIVYEMNDQVPKAVFLTANVNKLPDNDTCREISRRSHLFEYSYYRGWWSYIFSYNAQTLRKALTNGETAKTLREYTVVRYTEYMGEPEHIGPLDVKSLVHSLVSKVYQDNIKVSSIWTMPQPENLDFVVTLKKSFAEIGTLSKASVVGSYLTGNLVEVYNRTGRFNQLSSVGIVMQIFKQSPEVACTTIEQLVMNFNDCHVEVDFGKEGVCIIRSDVGTFGVIWNRKVAKMFVVDTTIDSTADYESMFGDAEGVYKELKELVVFKEGSVEELERNIKESAKQAFISKNKLCLLLEAFLSLASIMAQVYAPLALIKGSFKQLRENNQLDYLKRHSPHASDFYEGNISPLENWRCTINVNNKAYVVGSIKALERLLERKGQTMTSLEKRVFSMNHPEILHWITHDPNTKVNWPLTFEMFAKYGYGAVSPIELESLPLDDQTYTTDVYSGTIRMRHRSSNNGVFEEAWFYDVVNREWVKLDRVDDDSRYLRFDEKYDPWGNNKGYNQEDDYVVDYEPRGYTTSIREFGRYEGPNSWADMSEDCYEESTVKRVSMKAERAKVESTLKKQQQRERRPVQESTLKQQQKKETKPKTESITVGNVKIWHSGMNIKPCDVPKLSGLESAIAYKEGSNWCYNGVNKYAAYMAACFRRNNNYDWVVLQHPATISNEELEGVVGEQPVLDCVEGDIVVQNRGKFGFGYKHFGIVAKDKDTDRLCIFHVQSVSYNGKKTSFIACEPLAVAEPGWFVVNYDNYVYVDGRPVELKQYENFDHVSDLKWVNFAYNVDASNCETWALAMKYVSYQVIPRQIFPQILVDFSNFFVSFKTDVKSSEFEKFHEKVTEEACLDPSALHLTRRTLPNNIVTIKSPMSGKRIVYGIGVAGRLVVTVAHAGLSSCIVERNGKDYAAERIVQNTRIDFAIYKVTDNKMPEFKNIVDSFMTREDMRTAFSEGKSTPACLLMPYENDVMFLNTVTITGQIDKSFDFENRVGEHGLKYTAILRYAEGTALTESGDCGLPLVAFNKRFNRKIVGIHRAGSELNMYATLITNELIRNVVSQHTVKEQANWTSRDGVMPWLGENDECQETGFPIVGYPAYKMAPVKGTKLHRVPFDVPSLPSEHEPAILSSGDVRAIGYEPVVTTLEQFKNRNSEIDDRELEQTSDEIADYLATILPGDLHVLTLSESINGPSRQRYPFAGAIDRKSSAGYPQTVRDRVMNKDPYFRQTNDQEIHKIADTDKGKELLADVSDMLSAAGRGQRPGMVFTYFPKDEALKQKKIRNPKTRGILSSNLPYLLNYRRYFYALHLRTQEIFEKIPIKIGINPLSDDWNRMTSRHLKIGELGFDADAEAWDATVPVKMMKACCNIVNKIYKKRDPNWSEQDDVIRSSLHACVEKPYVLFHGKVVQLPQGQVSGQPGTAFDNSLVNWILVLMIWKRLAVKAGKPQLANIYEFMQNVELSVYGDDMFVTVSTEGLEFFTLDSYTVEARKIGFVITNAQKDGKMVPYVPLTQMTFLKRGFVRVRSQWAGPLEIPSLGKSLKWLKGPGSYVFTGEWRKVSDFGLIRMNCEQVLPEVSLHGKTLYDKVLEEINSGLVSIGMEPIYMPYNSALGRAGIVVGDFM